MKLESLNTCMQAMCDTIHVRKSCVKQQERSIDREEKIVLNSSTCVSLYNRVKNREKLENRN